MSHITNQNTEPLFIFDMPDDEVLSQTISVKGEKGERGDPTKLSQLDNDTGFITKSVSDLTNYYTKTEADTALSTGLNAKLDKTTFNAYAIPSDFYTSDETVSGTGNSVALVNTSASVFKAIAFRGDVLQDGTPTPSNPVDIDTVTGEQTITITGDGTQEYTVDFGDIELCKIGNYQDYIYKNSGKWYKHKEINRVVLDGSTDEGWATSGLTYRPNSVSFSDLADVATTQALSNIFTVWDNTSGGITTNIPNLRFGWGSTGNKLMAVRYDASESLEGFKELLSSTPMVVYYELDEPVEEEITDQILVSQLEVIDRARSFNGTTIITATGTLPAILYVEGFKGGWSGTIGGVNAGLDKKADNTKLINRPHYFNSVSDMQNSTDLTEGSYAKTLGYYTINDGGGALYYITKTGTADGGGTISVGGLYAHLVVENDEVNVKQFGAYGDNIHDDYNAFAKACSYYKNILIPAGTYKLSTTVTLSKNNNIYGKSAVVTWSGNVNNTDKTEIVTTDVYAFTCSWGNVNNFSNITFSGKGINQPCGAKITKCEFKGDLGINYARVCSISACSFHNCTTAGIVRMVDTSVMQSYFYYNETAIDMTNSGDNTVIGNKIEWNNLGIKLSSTVYAVIANNNFDRNTTYAISGDTSTNLNINANNFERNLTAHIKVSGSYITISNNQLLSKNSEDDQSGTLQPTVALDTPSISNSMITNNAVYLPAGNNTSKLFNAYPSYVENVRIEGNTLNGLNTDRFTINMGKLTSSTTAETSITYATSNLDYLGMTIWTIRLVLPRLVSNNVVRSFSSLLKSRVASNSGNIIYEWGIDDTAREYDCYADCEITNKYEIKI